MEKYALILWLDGKDGGVQRRLARVYSEIAKSNNVSIIVRSPVGLDVIKVLKEMKVEINHFQSIKCFSNRLQMILEYIRGDYKTIHFAGSGFSIIISILLGKIFDIKTVVTVECVYSKPSMKYKITSPVVWKYVVSATRTRN